MPPSVTFPLDDGGRFVSDGSDPIDAPFPPLPDVVENSPQGKVTEEDLLGFVNRLWREASTARQPETARLKMLEKLYRGYHYRDASLNRTLEVTNHCFSTVETAWPHLVALRPMPKVQPRSPLKTDTADRLSEFANWLQSQGRIEHTRRISDRVKLKYGYSIVLVTVDRDTGMPYLVDWSPFDWYPDPSARNLLSAEYFFLAAPASTRRLRSMFPHCADRIVPDNYTSPLYDVTQYLDLLQFRDDSPSTRYGDVVTNLESTPPYQSSTGQPAAGGQVFVGPSGQVRHQGSDTTFLVQLLIRDDQSTRQRLWAGTRFSPDPVTGQMVELPGMTHLETTAACPSGWRMIQMVPGKILSDEPVDACFLGLPFCVDYDYERENSLFGIGEIDNIAPINRGINERKNALNRSLRLQAAPVVIAPKGSGVDLNKSGVEPGDVLDPTRGVEIKYLEYSGPHEQQFEHLSVESHDMDAVSGLHPAIEGERPAGIEAGVAISQLYAAASMRLQAKIPGALEVWSQVLKKMCAVAGKKLSSPILFRATSGQMMHITPDELAGEYEFYFDRDQSQLASQQQRKDDALTLGQVGALTPAEVLKQIGYPNWQNTVAARMQALGIIPGVTPPQNTLAGSGGGGAGSGADEASEPSATPPQRNGAPSRS